MQIALALEGIGWVGLGAGKGRVSLSPEPTFPVSARTSVNLVAKLEGTWTHVALEEFTLGLLAFFYINWLAKKACTRR